MPSLGDNAAPGRRNYQEQLLKDKTLASRSLRDIEHSSKDGVSGVRGMSPMSRKGKRAGILIPH